MLIPIILLAFSSRSSAGALEIQFLGPSSGYLREARNICYLQSWWPLKCRCTRITFSDGQRWLDVICSCQQANRARNRRAGLP